MKAFLQKVYAKSRDNSRAAISMVALGDSVTQGVMDQRRLEAVSTYHRQLQGELEAFFPTCTFNMINAGISGDSAVGALTRLDRDVLRHQPDLVMIGFGLNDSTSGEAGEADFCCALNTLVSRIRSETESSVILLTPPFMARKENGLIHPEHVKFAPTILAAQNSGALSRYAQHIRDIAAKHSVALADVHAEWQRIAESGLDTDIWLTNGLNHPNRNGHQIAKTLVFHQILQAHLAL